MPMTNIHNVLKPIFLNKSEMVAVGRLGKSVGLNGALRLFLLSDFSDVVKNGACFYLEINEYLESILKKQQNIESKSKLQDSKKPYIKITIQSYNTHNNTIRLKEFNNRDSSDMLRNLRFFSTIDETRQSCILKKDEFFYFDIIGLNVIENNEILGVVKDITQIANTYYFVLEKNFLIPYIDRYVLDIDVDKKQILTQDAKYLKL